MAVKKRAAGKTVPAWLEQIAAAPADAVVEIPSGRHELEAPIALERGVELRAQGATIVAPKGATALVVRTTSPVCIHALDVEGSRASAIEAKNAKLTLRSCTVIGPGYSKKIDGCHGIDARGGELLVEGGSYSGYDSSIHVTDRATAHVDSALLRDSSVGICVTGAAHAFITNTTSEANVHGVAIDKQGSGVVTGCVLSGNREVGGLFQGVIDVEVSGNLAEKNGLDGFNVNGSGSAKLARNQARNNGRHGIYLGGTLAVEVFGNLVSDNRRIGIWAHGTTTGTARHNWAVANGEHGFDSNGVDLVENVALRNTWSGFGIGGRAKARLVNRTLS